MQPELVQILLGVIGSEMDLKPEQTVVYNQRWKIPPDSRLYVTAKFLSGRPYAVRRGYDPSVKGELSQKQSLNQQTMFTFNVMSNGTEALVRKEEVIMALSSDAAERAAERYSFSIGRIPASFVDLSTEEGAAILYRYAITIPVLNAVAKTSKVPFFDTFPRRLIVQP